MDGPACVHLRCKGRKQRSTPLWKGRVQEIRAWLRKNPTLASDNALLPNRDCHAKARCNVTQRFNLAVDKVTKVHGKLSKRSISPHTIRHTAAMHQLQSGVAFNVIALWLGHESTTTTHRYVVADLAMKHKALVRLQESDIKIRRYPSPDDALMKFLQEL